MKLLILKLGATGDVVRTTPLLQRFTGPVTWITAEKNVPMLEGIRDNLRCFSWEQRQRAADTAYDLVINLEDTADVAGFIKEIKVGRVFGACLDAQDHLTYTPDSKRWFDLSLISSFGKQDADRLKLLNRRTYQELIFESLGYKFSGEQYFMPQYPPSALGGDVAIAAEAGPVWPMKNWAYYNELKNALEKRGLTVNVLPRRPSLLEHLSDVAAHRCLVGGDSLPMHLALGTGVRCVSIFTCTSPWEIHGYGIQKKIVSPLLEEFFYKRHFDVRATTAIPLDEVLGATLDQLRASASVMA
jgi:heptosyltransferase-2